MILPALGERGTSGKVEARICLFPLLFILPLSPGTFEETGPLVSDM